MIDELIRHLIGQISVFEKMHEGFTRLFIERLLKSLEKKKVN